ncbi:MAG: alpha/beta hydrolase [Microcoleaceae cyanobacterium MO_207.B10]|nr:alpha/beta hydrolase [Microcoleaceae cyanobacterium MO_207.B10]
MKSKSVSKFFFRKVGIIIWCLLLGIIFSLIGLHLLGLINGWQFPLKGVIAFLGGGGLACFLISWIIGKPTKKLLICFGLSLIIAVNLITFIASYSLTHYKSFGKFGLGIPRPVNYKNPTDVGLEFVTQKIPINSNKWLEIWLIPATNSQGIVILFPGHKVAKGRQLLPPAKIFHSLNYDTVLVDYQGVGGSSGNQTTIGAKEAKDVASAMTYIQKINPNQPIILYGISMGSAAILRAIALEKIEPDAIIIEMPFVNFLDAVKVRIKNANIPPLPLAELLVFWGSIQHGFNGFAYNPVDYAKQVNSPTLLMQGEQDKWVTVKEIKELFNNLKGDKKLVIFPNTGHELLVSVRREKWYQNVEQFLRNIKKN